ncbi:hypothetical protein, partial [Flammeovirga sp. SJP92]|uniref:hypothetical protein n=1 Tax=Flammeovirga sp. SJP92 TaxID=1775430 RepID=UPI0012F7B920
MRENILMIQGLQHKEISIANSFFEELFFNSFVGDFDTMQLEYKSKETDEYEILIEGEVNKNRLISFLSDEKYRSYNLHVYLRNKGILVDLLILGDIRYKDERDNSTKYSNYTFTMDFNEIILNEDEFLDLYNFYKLLFLEFTVPIRYDFGTVISNETTKGKYSNELIFRHKNDFPFTGILICWKMILGELYFDEDYTFEKIVQTPALYNTPLLKQVDGRDYNLIELHTYKDFYNYESDESMKSLRETYGYLREAMLELEK